MIHCQRPCAAQVDGAYEDWVEVLRLVYYSGGLITVWVDLQFLKGSILHTGLCPSTDTGAIPSPTADLELGSPPSELSCEAAYRIYPIAHQYDLQLLLRWCGRAVDRAPLDLWPSAPIASSQVPMHTGLLQWLALADLKQCALLVETCLSQLLCQDSDKAIHEAVASPHLRQLIDGLRPETKTSIICKMAGLPLGFQVMGGGA